MAARFFLKVGHLSKVVLLGTCLLNSVQYERILLNKVEYGKYWTFSSMQTERGQFLGYIIKAIIILSDDFYSLGRNSLYIVVLRKVIVSQPHQSTLFARSFRRRFFAYHYAVNHPHTNIILSLFSFPLVLKCAAKILKIGLQIKI